MDGPGREARVAPLEQPSKPPTVFLQTACEAGKMKRTIKGGFTLIELLMVVVIIGLLASIAIPKFQSVRERAYMSALRADLRNLANQQDVYYNENYSYSTNMTALEFVNSEGVIVTFGEADNLGWSASSAHAALGTTQTCAIYHGSAAQVSPATVASSVQCTN
jgi:prepilin-type N-terminal cleavage/methylation domain-containing protein